MPIELTSGQWISAACAAVGVIAGANALRRDQRWFALCCGLVGVQSLLFLIVPHDRGHSMRYVVSVPLGIAVLVILRRVGDEAKLVRATRTDAARESQP
ncbi:MAG TPA: hypothetical protein VIW69_00975 [Candidatus Elarobacter sp.]